MMHALAQLALDRGDYTEALDAIDMLKRHAIANHNEIGLHLLNRDRDIILSMMAEEQQHASAGYQDANVVRVRKPSRVVHYWIRARRAVDRMLAHVRENKDLIGLELVLALGATGIFLAVFYR